MEAKYNITSARLISAEFIVKVIHIRIDKFQVVYN